MVSSESCHPGVYKYIHVKLSSIEPGEGDGRSSSSRGSADEQEPMDQTRLNELVNETVHGKRKSGVSHLK